LPTASPRRAAYLIQAYDMPEKDAKALGIGCFRANWTPDSKSVVANGVNGRDWVMVRCSLIFPGNVTEQSTEYKQPSSPATSWDGKEIVFIARKPRSR